MTLDPATLLLVIMLVAFLLAGLILLAGLEGRERPALLYLAGAYASYGLAAASVVVFSATGRATWPTIWGTNVLFLGAYGLVWCSLRRFGGKSAGLGPGLAGAVIWTGLCVGLWPWFGQVMWVRVAVYSVLVVAYMLIAIVEVLPEWRRNSRVASTVLFLLALHALIYVYRTIAWLVKHGTGQVAWDYTLINFEGLLFSVGLAVSVLLMVRGRAEYQFRYASLHDELTGLPNRRALFGRGAALLEAARASDRDAILLMCDLDHFKLANDRFGHDAGDRVLKVFARILLQSVEAEALVARLGGEEFVVLVAGSDMAGARQLAERIRVAMASAHDGLPARQTTSVGIACTCDAGFDLDRLLTQADLALYAAKAAGRDCVRAWTADLPEKIPPQPVARSHRDDTMPGDAQVLGEVPSP